ncbi:molybdenum cofactor guanylyltransferase [Rothia nasisuis]|uniref:molybdenum cofactor guanylyltransferase n=3 Tax=Rothia nasisuis TaxID=2109647 RepID=UPI001F1D3BBD|nr:NTP transferase domain-containing protein [Rothia nasisuis]
MKGLTFSALVLAGGRSSRLGGVPKALLTREGSTLLSTVLAACEGAVTRVVVGPATLPLPADVILTREEPPFSGPAAGISAGLTALAKYQQGGQIDHWVLLLSCDLPHARTAVPHLLAAAASAPQSTAGFRAIAGGLPQHLLGIYRLPSLIKAFTGDTANASVHRFLKLLAPTDVPLERQIAADVDTWDDAASAGFTAPPGANPAQNQE